MQCAPVICSYAQTPTELSDGPQRYYNPKTGLHGGAVLRTAQALASAGCLPNTAESPLRPPSTLHAIAELAPRWPHLRQALAWQGYWQASVVCHSNSTSRRSSPATAALKTTTSKRRRGAARAPPARCPQQPAPALSRWPHQLPHDIDGCSSSLTMAAAAGTSALTAQEDVPPAAATTAPSRQHFRQNCRQRCRQHCLQKDSAVYRQTVLHTALSTAPDTAPQTALPCNEGI